MKVSNRKICIIIVSVCVSAALACVALSRPNKEDKDTSSAAAASKNLDWKLLMVHGPAKDGLAAFLICERKQFKLGEPIPVLYGVLYGGPEEGMTIVRPYRAYAPHNFSWFSITGPDGRGVPYKGLYPTWAAPGPKNVLLLERGEFHGRAVRVAKPIDRDFIISTPGTYTLTWHYEILPPVDLGCWVGELVSNEVHIEIVK